MSIYALPNQVLNRIGLTLSGGGYRAAAFHLGTLDYLNHVKYKERPLIEYIEILSTVSGGTICGAPYAWHLVQKRSTFEMFFKRLYAFMGKFDLIHAGLVRIEMDEEWTSNKNRNLINSFSKIYSEELFEGDTFNPFLGLEKGPFHLKEVIFNATEFKYGLPFRFQNTGRFGNGRIWLTKAEISEIKLGDIVAASSCFPSGFEPIAFPDDFMRQDSQNLQELVRDAYLFHEKNLEIENLVAEDKYDQAEALRNELKEPTDQRKNQFSNGPIGLMDGGIVDNQGINAILMAESRRREKIAKGENTSPELIEKQIDLLIISDVSSPFMNQMSLADYSKYGGDSLDIYGWVGRARKKTFRKLLLLGIFHLLSGLLLLGIGILQTHSMSLLLVVIVLFLGILLIFLGSIILFLPLLINRFFQKIIRKFRRILKKPVSENVKYRWEELLPRYVQKYTPIILNLELDLLGPMILDRVSSVGTMVSDIFLKQVRRLIYDRIYQDDKWANRRISNFVYELREENHVNNMKKKTWLKIKELRQPGEKIMEVAGLASSMKTTLWFTKEDMELNMMENLIACGQFTICFNLLEYLYRIQFSKDYKDHPDRESLKLLYDQLIEDWEGFRSNPFFLLQEKQL